MVVAGGMEIASGALLGFQVIPGVPDDLKSWPVAAIGGLLGIMGLLVAYATMRSAMKNLIIVTTTMAAQTVAIGEHTTAQKATSDQIAEVCRAMGKSSDEFRDFVKAEAAFRAGQNSGKVTVNV